MLSLISANGHKWRCTFCEALQMKLGPDSHDYDDEAVKTIFEEAAKWADAKLVDPVSKVDHIAAFIASRDANRELVIPGFVRCYCAMLTDTPFIDDSGPQPRTVLAPSKLVPTNLPTLISRHSAKAA